MKVQGQVTLFAPIRQLSGPQRQNPVAPLGRILRAGEIFEARVGRDGRPCHRQSQRDLDDDKTPRLVLEPAVAVSKLALVAGKFDRGGGSGCRARLGVQ